MAFFRVSSGGTGGSFLVTIQSSSGGTQENGDSAYANSSSTAVFRIDENGATLVSGSTSHSKRGSWLARTVYGSFSITSVTPE